MDSVSIEQLESTINKFCTLSPSQKNELYHNILTSIRENDQKTASLMIFQYIENLLSQTKSDILSSLEYKREGKISPIFNRVG